MNARKITPPIDDDKQEDQPPKSSPENNNNRQPWFKFYPKDWETDPGLRMCSLAAQGLWMRLICIAHQGDPYGHVTLAKRNPTQKQLAKLVQVKGNYLSLLLQELQDAGVFSVTNDGVIFSRRMVNDQEKHKLMSKFGKMGGNPTFKQRLKPTLANTPKPEAESYTEAEAESRARATDLAKMPKLSDPLSRWEGLAEGAEIDEKGRRQPVVGKSYLVPVAQACTEAAGINDVHFRGDWRPIIEWLRQGLDPDDVIYPAIRDVVSRPGYQPGSIRSFAYFNGAVSDRAKAMQGGR